MTDPTGRPGRRKIYFGRRWRHWWPCAQRRSQAQYFQSLEMGVPYLWVRTRLWHIEIKAETRGVCTAVKTPDDPRIRDFMRLLSSPPTVLVRIIRYHRGRCQRPLERITLVAPLTPVTPPRPTPVTPLKLLTPTSVSRATGPAYTNLKPGQPCTRTCFEVEKPLPFLVLVRSMFVSEGNWCSQSPRQAVNRMLQDRHYFRISWVLN